MVRRRLSGWVAILAAYALVLQVVAAGLSAAAQAGAAAPMLDAFGVIICTIDASGEHGGPSRAPEPHGDASCLATCAIAGTMLVGLPTAPGLAAPRLQGFAAAPSPIAGAQPSRTVLDPLGPRGPPAAT